MNNLCGMGTINKCNKYIFISHNLSAFDNSCNHFNSYQSIFLIDLNR